MLKRILVGVADRRYSIAATRHAIHYAKICDAKLTAISVLDYDRIRNVGPVAMGAGEYAKELREARFQNAREAISDSLDGFVRLCEADEIPYEIIRETGDPLTEFINASRYNDLVVVGLHDLFEHGVMNEPPDSLIKLVSAGVRPMFAVTPQFHDIKRVLVAYSGSIESAKTLRCFAQNYYLWPETSVRVVSFGSSDSNESVRLTDADEYLQAHGVQAETEFVVGSARQLLEYAKDWKADMIVLGNSAKSLLRRRIFGETALHAIRESEIPLFLSQ